MKILVADDDDAYRLRLARALEARGHDVITARDGAEAMHLGECTTMDAAILDLKMPCHDGIEVLRQMIQKHPDLRILIHTGYGSIASAMEAVRLGAIDYRIKPTDVDALISALQQQAPDEELPLPLKTPSLERVEWEHIQRVIADCRGNISEAARTLGLHRRSLQRKLQKYPPQC